MISLSVPSFADNEYNYEWPPPIYEMDYALIDSDTIESAMSGFRASLPAFGNTFLIIFGVITSVGLIRQLFVKLIIERLELREYQGVSKREFNRRVTSLDRRINRNDIVDEQVSGMEIHMEAKKKFRERNPNADLNEKIYQRELSHQTDSLYRSLHPNEEFHEAMRRSRLSHSVKERQRELNPNAEVKEGLHRREVSRKVTEQYRDNHPDEDVEENVYRREVSFEGGKIFRNGMR